MMALAAVAAGLCGVERPHRQFLTRQRAIYYRGAQPVGQDYDDLAALASRDDHRSDER